MVSQKYGWFPEDVAGRYEQDARLSRFTWFQTGGPADILFRPRDIEDLQSFLTQLPSEIDVTVIGAGSNVIVRDGGIRGVVIKLGRGFTQFEIQQQDAETAYVHVGAGMLDATLAQMACEAGWGGLSFLSGIPGTIGGALRMNAGAYGREIKECLVCFQAIDRQGKRHDIAASDVKMTYRHCNVAQDWIFVSATLKVNREDPDIIRAQMADIRQKRQESQPIRGRTGGSTFANPPGQKAWQLIDAVGGRGYRIGDAQMSEKHCNFMLNLADASATDLEQLGEEMRQRVAQRFGTELRWEIKRLGDPGLGEL